MAGRPINALELYSRFRDEMSKPDPFRANEVPVDRGFLAPLATYSDGQTELAWPTFPVGAVIDGVRSFGAMGFDTPESVRHNAGAAADVAGGAVTGGLGLGLAGGLADNAVGSAGGKLTRSSLEDMLRGLDQMSEDMASARASMPSDDLVPLNPSEFDLPSVPTRSAKESMDNTLAALEAMFGPREKIKKDPLYSNSPTAAAVPLLQNALERAQPQGIRAYHGTNREFDTFDPAFMGSRGATDEGAFFFGGPKLASEYADGEFSIPDARRSELYQANLTPDGRLKVADYNRALEAEMEQTALGRVIPADIDTSNFATRNFGGYRWDRDEGAKLNRAIEAAKAEGKSGLVIQGMTDATGITDPQYAVWGRGTVYSPTTGKLLYSEAPTAAAVPLAGETQDTDPALLEYLRAVGLY